MAKPLVRKIVSGGQTGVDRAALDVAMQLGIECGGWCPAGRLDENGRIPEKYPVRELATGGFAERTLQNVKDSDGTVVFHACELAGGSAFTVQCCVTEKRPHTLIDAKVIAADQAARIIRAFVCNENVEILNVAGPRESEWPGAYDYAFRALMVVLSKL